MTMPKGQILSRAKSDLGIVLMVFEDLENFKALAPKTHPVCFAKVINLQPIKPLKP